VEAWERLRRWKGYRGCVTLSDVVLHFVPECHEEES